MTFLVESSVRAAVMVAIGLILTPVLRRASAASRHSVLTAAMFCAAFVPLMTEALPQWNLEAPAGLDDIYLANSRVVPASVRSEGGLSAYTEPGSRATTPSAPASEGDILVMPLPTILNKEGSSAQQPPDPIRYIAIVWVGGATIVLASLLLGWARLVWIASKAQPVRHANWIHIAGCIARSYGLRRRIRLLQSHHSAILATWGLLRPKVVLPRGAEHWNEGRIEVVLRHELAHVRRHDWLIQIFSELLRAVYWFNPLIWIASARLRRESEQACDDTVLNSGVAGSDYAEHLLDLARTLRGPRHAWSPALLMARGSKLEQRFHALLNPNLNRGTLTRLAIVSIGAFFLGITLPIATLHLSAQETLALELPIKLLSSPLTLITQTVLPTQSGEASIEGVVVKMDTSEPLADVHVELNTSEGRGHAPTAGRVVTTGQNGNFVFRNVLPGDYELIAAREGGYLPAQYGQRTATGPGLTIKLTAGQKITDLRISMAQPGSITGRVLDQDGEPIGRAQVQALRTVYLDGQRSESIVASVATDDRGEYRLYWLPPGQYHVSATPQDVRRGWVPVIAKSLDTTATFYTLLSAPVVTRRVLESGEVQEEVQVPTYFPGTTDVDTSSFIDVRAGVNVPGVNITTTPAVRAHHIRGILIDSSTGQPISDGAIRALPLTNNGNLAGTLARSDRNGRFEISGIVPGPYVLSGSADSRGERNGLAGTLPVTIGNADLENISLLVSRGSDIPVQVTVEGRVPGGGVTFRLQTVPGLSFFGFMPMRPGSPQRNLLNTDKFMIEGVSPGDYKFSFFAMGGNGPRAPLPVYVKSMKIGGSDVLNGLLHVDGPVEHPLEIVLSANVGTFEGTVVNSSQEPVANVSVALIPNMPFRSRLDLYKTGITDESGHFRISGVAPGDYRAFSWEAVEGWPWQDPQWLEPWEGRGRPIHFAEGSKESLQLTVMQ